MAEDKDSRSLMTNDEFCDFLNVIGKQTGYRIIREVLPRGVKVKIGRLIRVDRQALERWIAEGGDLGKDGTTSVDPGTRVDVCTE